ncbi:MAG: YhfC family intramembrane metalloprotease [Chloroflexi bacterium]|nr:YhfC family intramembrane metalloprotease [Chloroflexota bacterium]
MLITNIIISAIGMILLPLVAGYFIAKRFQLSFKNFRGLFIAGALTFIASQILHIPFLYGLTAMFKNGTLPSPPESWSVIFNAVLLGLLAGIFEETSRYVLFKYIMKNSRTWEDGITIGLGHGGIEAIFIGLMAISTLAQMTAMRGMTDLSQLGIPADQIEAVKTQLTSFWSQPDIMPFFGFMERISAMCLHIGLSVLVMYSLVSGQRKWFWFALLWHAFVDALAVYLYPKILAGSNVLLGTLGLESLVALLGVGLLLYAIRLRSSFPVKNEAASI